MAPPGSRSRETGYCCALISHQPPRVHQLGPERGHDSSEGPIPQPEIDAQRLAHELRASIEGEVRFDAGSCALYATDASNYRQVPIGVVIPRTIDDVLQTVALCRDHNAPVLPRGGGTSLAGQGCNVAVVM